MVRRLPPRLVLAALAAVALPGASVAALTNRYVPVSLRLSLGSLDAGSVLAVSGGAVRAEVVAAAPQADGTTKKHLGQPRFEDLAVDLALPLSAPVEAWVSGFLAGQHPVRSGCVHEVAASGGGGAATCFSDARVVGVTLTDLDSSAGSAPASLTLLIHATLLNRTQGGTPPATSEGGKGRKGVTRSSFRLVVPGVDTTRLTRVGGVAVRIRGDGALESDPLSVEFHEEDAAPWRAWAVDFVIQGNSGEEAERQAELVLTEVGSNAVGLRLQFRGVGIASLASAPRKANQAQPVAVTAGLYFEGLSLASAAASGATTGAPDGSSPPPDAADEVPPPPTEGDPRDEGARDPTDFPRLPGSVRVSFSYSRRPGLEDERAEYTMEEPPARVERAYAEALRGQGWQETSRDESGEIKKGNYLIDLNYRREERTARVVLSVVKDLTLARVYLAARPPVGTR